MDFNKTRTLIHDLANSFSIIDGSLKRALHLLNSHHSELTEEIQRISKADEHVKKSIQTIRKLRENVHEQISLYEFYEKECEDEKDKKKGPEGP